MLKSTENKGKLLRSFSVNQLTAKKGVWGPQKNQGPSTSEQILAFQKFLRAVSRVMKV